MYKFLFCLVAAACNLGISAAEAQSPTDIEEPIAAARTNTLNEKPIAQLSARLAYNSDAGPVVGLGFGTDRLFGRDQTLRFNLEAQEGGTRISFLYNNDAIFGALPTFGLRVLQADSRAGSIYGFDATAMRIEPRLTWRMSPTFTTSAYIYYASNEIQNVSATSSNLLRIDEGNQTAGAVGIGFDYRFPGIAGAAMRNARLQFGAEVGSTSRDHDFLRLTARADAIHVFGGGNVVFRSQLRVGALKSLSGNSSIGDRFMLGQASVRGFEFGGFGPRDLAVANTPALGGNYYGITRFDAQFPNIMGDGAERLTPGVFMDVGSLWGLDNAAGGVAGATPVDEGSNLRASVGLTLRIATGLGPIQMYVAHPVVDEDYDRTQTFGLTFSHSF
ncbi:BamA/TamA family outer membrane protein [Thalassobium sp. R2A62]|uniref:BamA/TamA family outer membrane protein n=1 Tax=Thalassobium sp. R2A62 TaxID=633131 RepID=UPI0001B1CBE1|nr:BamA/TamA family outer membrane protein [Thalassobium sp. R2A62]EET47413.1 outer membrane protein, OMP85 family [Thalassobium sp. R2A62]